MSTWGRFEVSKRTEVRAEDPWGRLAGDWWQQERKRTA
jgi:hypothetical protein